MIAGQYWYYVAFFLMGMPGGFLLCWVLGAYRR